MELIETLKTYTYVYETDEFTQFAEALISHGEIRLKLIVTRSCGKKNIRLYQEYHWCKRVFY